MARSKVLKNYLYSLSYQLIVLVMPLFLIPYLTKTLGETNLGVFDYIQAVVSYFVIFGSVGISLYGQREVAYVKNDPEKRSRIFWELFILRAAFLLVSLALYETLIARNSEQFLYYTLFAVEIVTGIFDVSWFFQGLEDFKIQTLRNFFAKTVQIILIFLFVKTEADLKIYILCYSLTNVFANLLLMFSTRRYLVKIPLRSMKIFAHFLPAFLLFLPQIATSVYTMLDKVMVGTLSDFDQVAFYSQPEKLVKLALTLVTSMNLVMLSRVADYQSAGDEEQIRRSIRTSFRFSVALACPLMFGLVAVAKRFVPWFFGPDWEESIPVMIILSPIVLLIGISGVFGVQYLLPTKRTGIYTFSVCTGTAVNLVCNWLLIPRSGAKGAAIATLIAEFAVLLVQRVALWDVFSPKIWLSTWKYFVSGAVMCCAVYYFGEFFNRRMGGTLLQVLLGAVLYVTLLWVLRDSFFLQTLERFLGKFHSFIHSETE